MLLFPSDTIDDGLDILRNLVWDQIGVIKSFTAFQIFLLSPVI